MSAAVILRPRITRDSIISDPAPFNYARQPKGSPRQAQVVNDAVVLIRYEPFVTRLSSYFEALRSSGRLRHCSLG